MVKKIKEISYKEAWEKLISDYMVSMGNLYKHLKNTYGEEGLVSYLKNVEIKRFREYFKSFTSKMESFLGKIAPGKAFQEKMLGIANEFQFFLGVGNIEVLELDSEKGVARLKYCPYQRASLTAPERVRTEREFYCKYQCGVYIKGVCEEVLGFNISFEPQKEGCIYRVSRK